MAEYIEQEKAYELASDFAGQASTKAEYSAYWKVARAINDLPAADVVEVVHGEWTNIRDYGDYCLGHCSVCRTPQEVAFPSALKEGFRYCRWCGAKMDGKGG